MTAWLLACANYNCDSTRAFRSFTCCTRPWHRTTEILATSPQYACQLQYHTQFARRVPYLQRKIVRTKKFGTNYPLRILWCLRTFWPIAYLVNDKGVILLATDDQRYTNVLQEMWVMPALQSGYQETSRTVLAAESTDDAMGINPHRLCNGASRRRLVRNHHDMRGSI